MRERPILFSAPMVRALLDGRKTQTRRPYKIRKHPDAGCEIAASELVREPQHVIDRICPYGQPGDQLWVRETWGYRVGCNIDTQYQQAVIEYNADKKQLTLDIPPGGQDKLPKQRPCGKDEDYRTYYDDYLTRYWQQWRPSIFMPHWASRILLEVVSVRVERLQDISEADAKAEGSDCLISDNCDAQDRALLDLPLMENGNPYRNGYALLWESINGAGSWAANPWVWVVEFRRLTA